MGLRQLAADRPAAHDQQVLGAFGEVEDRLVGEMGHVGQSRHRRRDGPGAGGDDEALRRDAPAVDLDRVRPGEARRTLNDVDAQRPEALDRIDRRDTGNDAVDMAVDRGEIDLGAGRRHTEAPGGAYDLRRMAGRQHRLGRHAAGVEAVAAHRAALDQHGARAELGAAGGDRQAGGPGADHADIDP